jgi:drug/metabolite transporter (DMT)-like permease
MSKSPKAIVVIFGVLCMLFWGMSFVWSKVVFTYYTPLTTIFLRLIISGAILYIVKVIWITHYSINKKDLVLFMASAFFSPFCYFLGESYGLQEVSSTVAAVIIAMIPVFSPFVGYFTLKEKLTVLNFLGLIVSFVGVIIMLIKKDLTINASLTGILLLIFAVISALAYSVSIKRLSQKYHPITIVVYQNLLGALYFLPFFLMFDVNRFLSVKPNFELTYSLLSLAIFASSIAFIFFTVVIRELGMSRANIYSNLIPVFTAVFSYFILNEEFTFMKLLGMSIVIFGVILAQAGKLKTP